MDDDGMTQVLEPVEASPADGGSGGPRTTATAAAAAGGGRPRKWIAAAVIIALLGLAGLGFALGTRDRGEKVAEVDAKVPDLRGMTLDRAGAEVLAAGFNPGNLSYAIVEASVAPSGTVLSQEPLPGTKAGPGSKIDIVLAQGPQPAVTTTTATESQTPPPSTTDAPAASGAGAGTSGSDGTGSGVTPPPPADPAPVLPDLPPAQTIDPSKLQPRIIDPGIFKLAQPTYKTVLEHEGFGGDWQSPAITLGDKPKRIWFTADGPYNYPCAVWAWGPGDTDWKLKTIWASYPGAFESEDGKGGTLIEAFNVGSGTYTILVRVNPEVKWWKVRIEQEQ